MWLASHKMQHPGGTTGRFPLDPLRRRRFAPSCSFFICGGGGNLTFVSFFRRSCDFMSQISNLWRGPFLAVFAASRRARSQRTLFGQKCRFWRPLPTPPRYSGHFLAKKCRFWAFGPCFSAPLSGPNLRWRAERAKTTPPHPKKLVALSCDEKTSFLSFVFFEFFFFFFFFEIFIKFLIKLLTYFKLINLK